MSVGTPLCIIEGISGAGGSSGVSDLRYDLRFRPKFAYTAGVAAARQRK